ncbi:hypothetical protein [Streptomyces sp. NBC_01565]|uniref:hypothetical protein n=1 Tax=unclassified Streptomyces TaxID=2593676 RepID=UPI0022565562|nr:hypothetical protein [Streptomyces sp. NBC_01565]MCX4545772.1 hypothetical protein [Streptomyces sp. NBC_01565]
MAMLAAQLRTARRAGRAMYDVTAHEQAAMPEQLLVAFPDTDRDPVSDHLDDEPRSAIDMTSVRALRESRTDVETLELTAGQLRHLRDAATEMGDTSRVLRQL